MAKDFLRSRYDFVAALADQVSMNTGEPLYDTKGTAARAALLGISKSKIKQFLEKDKMFSFNKNLLEDSEQITDPIEKARLLSFKDFYETLDAMEDPDQRVSLKEEIIDKISEYKDSERAIMLVDDGATPKEIFSALTDSEQWKEDARDFITRDYVDLPSKRQKNRWSDFQEIVDLINDLKALN